MFLGTSILLIHFLSSSKEIYKGVVQISSELRDTLTFEVCMSPGCVADGAEDTLSMMLALAPPDVGIKPGVCCSLCGNGPIILEGNRKIRKVSQSKVVTLLFGDDGMNSEEQAVFDALNMVKEANDAMKRKNFKAASELYEAAIDLGLEPALALEDERNPENEEPTSAQGIKWVINARQQEALSKLKIGDIDGAVSSAESAQTLSQNLSPGALEVLQEACAAKGDKEGEIRSLRAFFALPEPEKMTTMESNKRRQLGFRLDKLEREEKG
eukprot:scaffold4949_cov134-Cylindrotheca_fusiformis.AAC.4